MAIEIQAPRLVVDASPRQTLKDHFKSISELPIRGGWGYKKEDAIVIDKADPVARKDIPFDGIGIEHVIVEKRIYEELIISRPKGQEFAGIKWKKIDQRMTVDESGIKYDHLRFDVTALPASEFKALKEIWEGPDGVDSPDFDMDSHRRRHEASTVHYVAEYWFDVTSFFGRYD